MSAFFQALQQKFGAQIQSMSADRDEEIYLFLGDPDVRALSDYLRSEFEARLVTVFGEDRRHREGVFFNYYVFERKSDRRYLIVRTPVRSDDPEFPSFSAQLPAVNWQEREIQDWFGLKAVGHPNPRRVALHDNWPNVHPLRKDFPLETVLPPFEGERHLYRPALGEGVFQVPVGPVHAGTIEPGHFNFAVAGEPILYLQLRMFYTHKGTEKLFERLPIHKAVFLAESISGDSSFSHGTAFCQAIERAAQMDVPLRALIMRTILLELERIYNHVGDIGGLEMTPAQHDFRPHHHGRVWNSPAVGVKHGNQLQHAIALGQRERIRHREHHAVQHHRSMRVQHSLRVPRRAGCVASRAGFVFV